jgi:pimeloyl-ACP methyl ester carboxylesterase
MSTIVLVPGGCLGAWSWERVTPSLAAAGHDVHPLTLTGFGDRAHLGSPATNLTTHATDVAAAIEVADLRDVVLVAHSYAGVPATIAASRIAGRLRRLVYLAAVLPVPGKTLFDIAPTGVEDLIMQSVNADGWQIPVMNDFVLDNFYGEHGLSPDDRAWMRARAVGQPVGTYREPSPADLSAVEALPRRYIVCAGDPGEPPVAPGTAGFDVVTLDSGHWPMITRPVELAHVIDAAARS